MILTFDFFFYSYKTVYKHVNLITLLITLLYTVHLALFVVLGLRKEASGNMCVLYIS